MIEGMMESGIIEREYCESLSDEKKKRILRGFTSKPRIMTDARLMATPSANGTDTPEENPSESVIGFAKTVGLPKHAKIVDLGTGNGRNAFGLYEAGWENVIAVDINPDNLAKARGRRTTRGYNIPIMSADIRKTEFRDDYFDMGISYLVLMTLLTRDDIKQAVAEARRIIKPGGYLVMATMAAETFDKFEGSLEKAWKKYLGKDESRVLHDGYIYLSRRDLHEMFGGFEKIAENPIVDAKWKIYNHRVFYRRKA